jgi:hypothetical protein
MDSIHTIMIAVILAVAVLVTAVTVHSSNKWKEFAAQHNCQMVADNAGTSSFGITLDGKMGMIRSASTKSFKCDDGVTYTR